MEKVKKEKEVIKESTEQESSMTASGVVKQTVGEKMIKTKGKAFPVFVIAALLIVALITLTLFILSSLKTRSEELKTLRNEALDALASSRVEIGDLDIKSVQENVEKINSLFPNETGLVNFVREIEKMKEGGIVKGITFVSTDAVRDKNKYLGIPFIIQMEGGWENIDSSLQSIERLPYLVRTITVDSKVTETGSVNFKYGGFIYVDESLAKSR